MNEVSKYHAHIRGGFELKTTKLALMDEVVRSHMELKSVTDNFFNEFTVVATTCRNGTRDMLTSAKLSVGYLVVGITRELDKEPSLHCSSIYTTTSWSML